MFSTSAPFFNPGNSEEGSGSNSSNSGSPANPDGSNSSNSGSPANPDGSAPISAKAESIKAVYYEKKAERSRVGEEYKKVNDIDSAAQDASDSDPEEQLRAHKALLEKTDEFKSADFEVQKCKLDFKQETGQDLSESE
jgi:hypothetical protein